MQEAIDYLKDKLSSITFSKKQVLVAVALILALIITVILTMVIGAYNRVVVKPSDRPTPLSSNQPFLPNEPEPDPLAPYGVLLLGYGGGSHDGGKLTDTIMVANVQPKDRQVTLISIPRDTWVELPIRVDVQGETQNVNYKINAAYAIGSDDRRYTNKPPEFSGEAGGGNLAKYAAESVTGIPIKYFAAVSFYGFERAIDTLGGIWVDVPVTFTDQFYPLPGEENNPCGKSEEEIEEVTATMSGFLLEKEFPCRYEVLRFQAGREIMDGKRALKFARSRHSGTSGGDFSRVERQQAVIKATRDRVLSLEAMPKLLKLIPQLSGDVQTDISASVVQDILSTHGGIDEYEISSLTLSDDNVLKVSRSADGQFILVPKEGEDWEQVLEFIKNQVN